MNVMIESAQVARGAAGEWVPGSAGWAGHPASHGHASNASGSGPARGIRCVCGLGERVPRHLAEVWDLQLPCPGLPVRASHWGCKDQIPDTDPALSWAVPSSRLVGGKQGGAGAALWAGIVICGSLLSASGQWPRPQHTVCLGGREAGTLGPYLGSWLGSGWVLSRAQELKRSPWGRVWGGFG